MQITQDPLCSAANLTITQTFSLKKAKLFTATSALAPFLAAVSTILYYNLGIVKTFIAVAWGAAIMLNTATAYSTTPTGPFTSENNTIDARDSQSKLREILRDQSRREEQHYNSASSLPAGGFSSTIQRHGSFKRKSAISPSLASGGMTSSASGGYFAGSSAMRAGLPSGRREATISHSMTTGGLDNYAGSSASLTSHLHRERSSRQSHTDQLGSAPEITSANDNKMARSHSTAGLTKGLDLKVVILGAQGEFNVRGADSYLRD